MPGILFVCNSSDYSAVERTAEEIRNEIAKHVAEKKVLEETLPYNFDIGPIALGCEDVRTVLIQRRKDLAVALLELLATKLREQSDEVYSDAVIRVRI